MRTKIIWRLRQLVPTKYRTTYTEKGFRYRCDWWMWFGRHFGVKQELIDL